MMDRIGRGYNLDRDVQLYRSKAKILTSRKQWKLLTPKSKVTSYRKRSPTLTPLHIELGPVIK